MSADNHAKKKRWAVESRGFNVVVLARDQWEAWDALKRRSLDQFGLVVIAEPDENGEPIPVKTETLMRRWGRDGDADLCHAAGVRAGLIADNEV